MAPGSGGALPGPTLGLANVDQVLGKASEFIHAQTNTPYLVSAQCQVHVPILALQGSAERPCGV